MSKKLFPPMLAIFAALVLSFTTNSDMKTQSSVDEAWFEYIGSAFDEASLNDQSHYEMLENEPTCLEGSKRCAIKAQIVVVDGVERPAKDGNGKVLFSFERQFNP